MAPSPITIPWWQPQTGERERVLVANVLDGDYLNDGSVTRQFEQQMAALVDVPYAIAVTSGTAALYLALMALDVGPGDEVIIPDITFVATANAVTMTGARPVLVDVEPQHLSLSPAAFEAAITPRTKAVVPVHVSGRAGTLDGVLDTARRHGIAVVEDAAEALLSRHHGQCLGTFGIAGCVSFSPNKIMTTGQGGMIFTKSRQVHDRLRQLKDQGRSEQGTGGDDQHASVGFNFKLTNLQAAVGLGQLEALPERLERQRRTYSLFAEGLAGSNSIRLFPVDIAGGETPLWVDALAEDRDGLCASLDAAGVGTRKFWHPVHCHPPYRRSDGQFPESSRLGPKALWLPSAFQLDDEAVLRVVALVNSYYGDRT
jgi:perosamine synthetase